MKITSFMTQYRFKKTDEEKEEMVKSHIKNEYVPFEKKADVAKAIVDATLYRDEVGINGEKHKVLHIDSVAKHMLTYMALVDLYTDIDRSKADGKMLDEFNMLNGSGVLDLIVKNIDQRELGEFKKILDMVCDDIVSNEYENHAFIKQQVERFLELFNAVITPILSQIDVNNIKDIISQNIV